MAAAHASAAKADSRGLGLLRVEWPEGDPGGLTDGATAIANEAEGLDGLARSIVDAALGTDGWTGHASDKMLREAQARAGVVTLMATPLITASSVLAAYAEILDDVQSQLVVKADRAVELEQAIETAEATASAARTLAAAATQRAQQATANDDAIAASVHNLAASTERAAAGVADKIASDAHEELERLRREAHKLVTRERKMSRKAAAFIEAVGFPAYDSNLVPAALSAGGDVVRVAIEDAKQKAADEAARKAADKGLLHGLLDAIGTIDPTPISDGINAGIYLAEGDKTDAALSAAGMIPIAGDALKIGGRVAKHADEIVDLGKGAAKHDMKSAYYTGEVGEDGIARVNGQRVGNHQYAGGYHPDTGVPYSSEGFPIFPKDQVMRQVKVPGMNGTYRHDERLANSKAGMTATPPGFTWHHVEDGLTMQLVPREIHAPTHHTGGAAIIREQLRQGGGTHP